MGSKVCDTKILVFDIPFCWFLLCFFGFICLPLTSEGLVFEKTNKLYSFMIAWGGRSVCNYQIELKAVVNYIFLSFFLIN